MKSEIICMVGDEEKEFPKLMKMKDCNGADIVYFWEYGNGVVIHGKLSLIDKSPCFLGQYSRTWDMELFKPFNDILKLKN